MRKFRLPSLQRHAPPGLNIKAERNGFLLLLGAATLCSANFLLWYFDEYDRLFYNHLGIKTLTPHAQMPTFAALMENSMLLFPFLALLTVAAAIDHYAYHWKGSKSIYTMRRLPNRWELHRRCLTLPLIALGITVVWALALIGIYAAIYQFVTPAGCLPPDAWDGFWRTVL
ncbi:MAG: hypothetical protein IJ347_07740 [Faecalibacterium sp.]|nr:hypothetical protein [Faecalibacterium sp.]